MITTFSKYYKKLPIALNKIVIAVCAICLFFILKEYTNHLINEYNYEFSWGLVSLKICVNYGFWLVLTPLIYKLSKLIQQWKTISLPRLIQFILGTMTLVIIHQLISNRLYDFFYYLQSGYLKQFFGQNNIVLLTIGLFSGLIELLLIMAVLLGFDYQRKFIENQKALVTAQLNTLRMQLHPHFLFNTLHSIASMIDIDTKNAQKMLTKIGDLLRVMLEKEADEIIPFKEELNFIKNYLYLEEIRFQDRITIDYEISNAVLACKIPNMVLQPLVENAVNHGIANTTANGNISIKAKVIFNSLLNKDCIEIIISNTTENNSTKAKGFGVGLKNVRQRLERMYNNDFQFETQFNSANKFVAKINLPINNDL